MRNVAWATVATVVVVGVAAVAGAVVTITDPSSLSFSQYMDDMKGLAAGGGLLAIGRGLHLGLSAGTARALENGAATLLHVAPQTVERDLNQMGVTLSSPDSAPSDDLGPEAEIPGGGIDDSADSASVPDAAPEQLAPAQRVVVDSPQA